MAIYLDSGFNIFARSSTKYEGMMTEIEYQGAIIAQFNEDKGEDIFEIDFFIDPTLPGYVSKFLLGDFLEAVDEAIKLLKVYRFISLYLVSSSEIQKEEFISFLEELGASIHKELNAPFIAIFSKELQKIEIALDNEGFAYREDRDMELLTQILGAQPETRIILELSRETKAQELAIELICKFAERWSCAVILGNCFFSSQQVFDLRSSGDIFTI